MNNKIYNYRGYKIIRYYDEYLKDVRFRVDNSITWLLKAAKRVIRRKIRQNLEAELEIAQRKLNIPKVIRIMGYTTIRGRKNKYVPKYPNYLKEEP